MSRIRESKWLDWRLRVVGQTAIEAGMITDCFIEDEYIIFVTASDEYRFFKNRNMPFDYNKHRFAGESCSIAVLSPPECKDHQ